MEEKRSWNRWSEMRRMVRRYFYSLPFSLHHRRLFEQVNTFCLFVGYPRSGHSLIGALLDAHPDALIAHELDALRHMYWRFSWRQLYYLIWRNSAYYASNERQWEGHKYHVPGQWQGRFRRLEVIGDKRGGRTTWQTILQPGLLERLQRIVPDEIKYIHVIRNPYDNIATISRRHEFTIADSIWNYFSLAEGMLALQEKLPPGSLLDLYHEQFLAEPKRELTTVCRFLGLQVDDDYLNDCAAILYDSPHQSRHKVTWTAEQIQQVQDKMARFPFLSGYTFAD